MPRTDLAVWTGLRLQPYESLYIGFFVDWRWLRFSFFVTDADAILLGVAFKGTDADTQGCGGLFFGQFVLIRLWPENEKIEEPAWCG
jgi:hypothetical protein